MSEKILLNETITRKNQRTLGRTIKLTANILVNGNANENSPLSYQLTNAINVIIRCSLKVGRMSNIKNKDIIKADNIVKQIKNMISNFNGVKVMTKEISTSRVITISGVRAYLDENNTAWINLEDAARGLGFEKTEVKNGVEYKSIRWATIREYLRQFNFRQQAGENSQEVEKDTYIPENIFYRLAMKAKNETAEKFQALVADEILPTIRRTGGYSVKRIPPTPIGDAVADIGVVAENIQSLFAVKRGIALAQAIDVVSINRDLKLDNLKQLLPSAEHEIGYLNATAIGKRLGITPIKANKLLEQANLQHKDGKDWRISEEGKAYGEEMPFTKNGHSDYQIRWNEAVIEVLGNYLN